MHQVTFAPGDHVSAGEFTFVVLRQVSGGLLCKRHRDYLGSPAILLHESCRLMTAKGSSGDELDKYRQPKGPSRV